MLVPSRQEPRGFIAAVCEILALGAKRAIVGKPADRTKVSGSALPFKVHAARQAT